MIHLAFYLEKNVKLMFMKLGARELRRIIPGEDEISKIKKRDIYIILDNVLDTYNVGAIFRLADALACRRVLLCGETETPPNSKIKKASVGTWQWVEWEYFPDAISAISKLKSSFGHTSLEHAQGRQKSKLQIVAIEQAPNSISYDEFDYPLPIALVLGNETTGIAKEVLNRCDAVVELPMFGVNKSLNVMVSLGIVLYEVVKKNKFSFHPPGSDFKNLKSDDMI